MEGLKALHAEGASILLDARTTARGERSLSISTHEPFLASVERFLLPAYARWTWNRTAVSPPSRALTHGTVARIRGPQGSLIPPFPRADPEGSREWTWWEAFLRSPLSEGWNAWARFRLDPEGPSVSLPLGPTGEESEGPPPHALGRDLLNRTTQRGLEMRWRAGGILVLWPERGARDQALAHDVARAHRSGALVSSFTSLVGGSGFRAEWVRTDWGRRRVLREYFARERVRLMGLPGPRAASLTPGEAARWLFPARLEPPWLVTPSLPTGSRGLPIGTDPLGGSAVLPWVPGEGHHLLVTGETGLGKSTLLTQLGRLVSTPDTSVILFDPLGETLERYLASLPADRCRSARLVAPVDSPIAMNIMAMPPLDSPESQFWVRARWISDMVNAFRTVRAERYGETFYWGPRIEGILTRVFLALSDCEGATLDDAARLLEDPAGFSALSGSPALASLRAERPEDLDGARRVLSELTLSPPLSRLLSSPTPKWDLREALTPGAVTLVALQRDKVGARAASYLGSLLLAQLWWRISARGHGGSKIVLMLDEVQEYANNSLIEMLQLGRKSNLHVCCATQSLSALSTEMQDALLTNCRDWVLFRGSPTDDSLVRDRLGVSDASEILSLPRGRALLLNEKANRVVPFSVALPSGPPALASERRLGWELAREATRPLWPEPRPEGPREVPRKVSALEEKEGPRHRALAFLFAESRKGAADEPLSVPLSLLRPFLGEDSTEVRRLGSFLKGTGALVRREVINGEAGWVLSRSILDSMA